MRINKIYPYMYYRIARLYANYEKNKKISYAASALVTLSQVLIFLDIIGIIALSTLDDTTRPQLFEKYYPLFILLVLVLSFYNDYKYKNKYEIFDERWKNEGAEKATIKGIMVVLLIVLPLVFVPILINFFN